MSVSFWLQGLWNNAQRAAGRQLPGALQSLKGVFPRQMSMLPFMVDVARHVANAPAVRGVVADAVDFVVPVKKGQPSRQQRVAAQVRQQALAAGTPEDEMPTTSVRPLFVNWRASNAALPHMGEDARIMYDAVREQYFADKGWGEIGRDIATGLGNYAAEFAQDPAKGTADLITDPVEMLTDAGSAREKAAADRAKAAIYAQKGDPQAAAELASQARMMENMATFAVFGGPTLGLAFKPLGKGFKVGLRAGVNAARRRGGQR